MNVWNTHRKFLARPNGLVTINDSVVRTVVSSSAIVVCSLVFVIDLCLDGRSGKSINTVMILFDRVFYLFVRTFQAYSSKIT